MGSHPSPDESGSDRKPENSRELKTVNDAGGPGRPERQGAVRADGGTDGAETDSPLTYDRNGNDRLRPGISKVDDSITCPECDGGLVHLPARDPANPYDSRTMIMCSGCFRALLVESTGGSSGEGSDDGEAEAEFPKVGVTVGDDGQTILGSEVQESKPDPEYTRERGGFVGYGYAGPAGVTQADVRDFETDGDDDDPEVRADGGEVVRRKETERETNDGREVQDTTLTRTDTGVRIKTKIQRGTGTNDRDTVTGEVRRERLGEAAAELDALETILRGHLSEIRGWDEDELQANEPAYTGGGEFMDDETSDRLRDAGEEAADGEVR